MDESIPIPKRIRPQRWRPKNPGYEARVRQSFAAQRAMAHIGATLEVVQPGFVEIHLPWRTKLTQQHGVIHGGIVSLVVDSACGFAALSLFPPGASVLAVEYKINFLAPARGSKLIGRGWVRKYGRTLTVCVGEAYVLNVGSEKLVASVLETLIQIHGRPGIPVG